MPHCLLNIPAFFPSTLLQTAGESDVLGCGPLGLAAAVLWRRAAPTLGKLGASGNPNGMWVKMNFYPPADDGG